MFDMVLIVFFICFVFFLLKILHKGQVFKVTINYIILKASVGWIKSQCGEISLAFIQYNVHTVCILLWFEAMPPTGRPNGGVLLPIVILSQTQILKNTWAESNIS